MAGGAALCISKHLEWLTSSRRDVPREHRVLFEIVFCCVLPLATIPIRTLRTRRF